MKVTSQIPVVVALSIAAACQPHLRSERAGTHDAGALSQKRYYGNIPFSIDFSDPTAFRPTYTAQDIAKDSNLAAFHFDWFGIPWPEYMSDTALPQGWIDQRQDISTRSDYAALQNATVSAIVSGTCVAGLPSSTDDQTMWVDRLVADGEALDMPFVVWWSNHAPIPLASAEPCTCTDGSDFCKLLNSMPTEDDRTSFRFFTLQALRDYDGTPLPALSHWTQAVAKERP